ncbi:MAG: serine hydrolase [Steroidobacteraceae bacterium]
MNPQRLLLVLVITALTLVSLAAGTLAADWPFWRRVIALAQLPDSGEWPDSFYQPVVRIGDEAGMQPVAPVAAEAERSIDAAALEAAAEWAARHGSVALLVMHRGRLQLERYWQGMAPDTLFSARAMSRTLVGFATGLAVADGQLALDDRADRWFAEWHDEPRGAITLRQLLHNVSGLEEAPPGGAPLPADAGPLARLRQSASDLLGRNARLALGTDIAAAALSFDSEHEPGARFSLSNASAQLVAVALERATGKPTSATWSSACGARSRAAPPSSTWTRFGGMPAAYCCFRATPLAFLRLGSLLAHDGQLDGRRILPAGWVAEMARGSRMNPNFGLLLWSGNVAAGLREYATGSSRGVHHGEPYAADDVLWMEGGGGGRSGSCLRGIS